MFDKMNIFSLLVLTSLIISVSFDVKAVEENAIVNLFVKGDAAIYGLEETLSVEIVFNDKDYYNSSLYLTYHIVEPETKEMLVWENERVAIPAPDEEGKVYLTWNIEIDKKYQNQKFIVVPDIVDIDKQYCFSSLEGIMYAPSLQYNINFIKWGIRRIGVEICQRPIVFGLNCIVTCLFVYSVIYMKRHKIL